MAEFTNNQEVTTPINYRYYDEFQKWDVNQTTATLTGSGLGAVLCFALAFNLDTPYAQRELNVQNLEYNMGIERQLGKADKFAAAHAKNDAKSIKAIQHQPKLLHITAFEGAEMTVGGGLLVGAVSAGVALWTRYALHKRRISKVNAAAEAFSHSLEQNIESLFK